ncbi:MAG: PglZ domain-containing protein [Chitinophagales bacterium]|nr:PglZ domain-containing protein [Bacteroidota bacterium]MCB9043618.1 PglZ domain-containing protein [Chitinophagales bacterium]
MALAKILWVDDEIEHLRPQIMFLEQRGYELVTVSNGYDALDKCDQEQFDVVFLDETMPGLTGIETLIRIKEKNQRIPIVMITKNEEENLMEDAIGKQIADYLIKPVKPQQILLTLKRLLENKRLVSEATNSAYQQEFSRIFMSMQMNPDYKGWMDIYKKLTYWELELDNARSREMNEVMSMQKNEANREFVRFVMENYADWVHEKNREFAPVMSHTLMKEMIMPYLDDERTTFLVVIDNLRYDQWRVIQPLLGEFFRTEQEDMFFSILPTATQYSRNAIFAGLLPSEIEKRMPKYWLNDADEGGKNQFEEEFFTDFLARNKVNARFSYNKVTNHQSGKQLMDNAHNLLNYKLNVIVYNFVDMLSHARTEMEVLKELASDETAYRSLTMSWFEHSPLFEILKKLSDKNIRLLITTDHGTIRVQSPVKVVGDRNTTTNLRYKLGKNLSYEASEVFEVRDPQKVGLPAPNLSSSFIFARANDFFVYPNNYNYYVNYFKDTFQHGGISMEEVMVPFVALKSK